LVIAWCVDLALISSVAVGLAWSEATLRGNGVGGGDARVLDRLAIWLSLHLSPALHGVFLAAVAAVAYTVYCAGPGRGQTLGRWLTRTTVVRLSGDPNSWFSAAVRTVASLVSFAAFGAGFFWSIIDTRHRTWHDLFAGTVIIVRRSSVHGG
jgi:uncharacterized RDD family membrane protein YckC